MQSPGGRPKTAPPKHTSTYKRTRSAHRFHDLAAKAINHNVDAWNKFRALRPVSSTAGTWMALANGQHAWEWPAAVELGVGHGIAGHSSRTSRL